MNFTREFCLPSTAVSYMKKSIEEKITFAAKLKVNALKTSHVKPVGQILL